MLIQVEYTQILSSLTITNSTKAKKMFVSHVTINKPIITPKGSRERHMLDHAFHNETEC